MPCEGLTSPAPPIHRAVFERRWMRDATGSGAWPSDRLNEEMGLRLDNVSSGKKTLMVWIRAPSPRSAACRCNSFNPGKNPAGLKNLPQVVASAECRRPVNHRAASCTIELEYGKALL